MIDPFGRVVGRLGLGRAGVLEAALPVPLPQPTQFARFGHVPLSVFLALAAVVLAAGWRCKPSG